MDTGFPQTLVAAIRHFSDPKVAFDFMVKLRWPDGVECPRCKCKDVRFISTRNIWECKECKKKKQFSVRVGTIFEDSPLGLDKWLAVIWMIANAKNGVSSYEVHRSVGVTQKTGWFMLQRIRLAMQTGSFEKMSGEVEVDETFIGGRARNMHTNKKRQRGIGPRGTGWTGKSVVVGLLERHSEKKKSKVRLSHVSDTLKGTLQGEVFQNIEAGSKVYTDEATAYIGIKKDYQHEVINHAECYVRGNVHTNGLENFWSLLKRTIRGTYVSIEPFHLFRYLDEQAFRFNQREGNDASRFMSAISGIIGKRLTYAKLIGEPRAV